MALKTVLVKGDLSNGIVSFSLTETDLSSGKWLMCLKQIAFSTIKDEQIGIENLSVSTNLVSDYRLVNNQREFYFPSLALLSLKSEQTPFSKSLDQIWFEINNPHRIIELFLKDCFTENPLILNCQVAIQVLLRRIC